MLAANQDLRAAAARVEQARAAAGLARSAGGPQLAFDPSVTRERTSAALLSLTGYLIMNNRPTAPAEGDPSNTT